MHYFLQSGQEIAETMRGRLHPLIDLAVLDILSSHHSVYGDGVKRTLLMLHHFLKRLKIRPHLESKWRCEILGQLGLFKRHILPELTGRLALHSQERYVKMSLCKLRNHGRLV